jgi:tellurite resistance protein TerC
MNPEELIFFSGFLVFIFGMLYLDLAVVSKNSHEVGFKEALGWSIFWIVLALGFYFFIYFKAGWIHGIDTIEDIQARIDAYKHPISISGLDFDQALALYSHNLSLEYITGYLIEKSLSVDNIFVIIMIFYAFGVNKKYYKRVLLWGILGAIVMRFIFIFGAAFLIQHFDWILYLFGALLVYTGVKMFLERNKANKTIDISKHPVVKLTSRYFRVFPRYVGKKFFIRRDHKCYITPMFLVVLVIEFSDLVFAADSIPAIFSITADPYIIFFSNIFAILGLRALFFLVIKIIDMFRFLKHGLSVLLTFIGIKLLLHTYLERIGFQTTHSLYIVLGILVISILLSIIFPKKEKI